MGSTFFVYALEVRCGGLRDGVGWAAWEAMDGAQGLVRRWRREAFELLQEWEAAVVGWLEEAVMGTALQTR